MQLLLLLLLLYVAKQQTIVTESTKPYVNHIFYRSPSRYTDLTARQQREQINVSLVLVPSPPWRPL